MRVIAIEIETLAPARPLRLERLESLSEALHDAVKRQVSWHGTLAGFMLDLSLAGSLTINPEKPRRRGANHAP
jgi:hypothetical protein